MTPRREIKQRSRKVWDAAKAAYLAGEPAASVARRFDVGYGNLRYRAHAEGWTRKAALARADAEAVEEAIRLGGQADETVLSAATVDDPEPVDPQAAHRRAVGRAAALLSRGRAAEATALLKAAETLARLTAASPPEADDADAPLSPEDDAAREAAAREHLMGTLDRLEAQADKLALGMLRDELSVPAVHMGFVLQWRARVLGPEVAAHDRAAREAVSPLNARRYYDARGELLPFDVIRRHALDLQRGWVRNYAGLPSHPPEAG